MNNKDKNNLDPSTQESTSSDTSENKGRRDAIKKTIAAGGVTIMAASWTRPVVESIVLPAHAQTSSNSLLATIIF